MAKARGLSRVILWAHDMGTSVAAKLLPPRECNLLPFEIAGLVLMNGSVHMEMAKPTLGERRLARPLGDAFARVSCRSVLGAQMRRVFAKPPTPETLGAMWTLIVRGEKDPVAVLPIAERLAREIPGAKLVTWPDLGHYPQVEDPERGARTVLDFTQAQR